MFRLPASSAYAACKFYLMEFEACEISSQPEKEVFDYSVKIVTTPLIIENVTFDYSVYHFCLRRLYDGFQKGFDLSFRAAGPTSIFSFISWEEMNEPCSTGQIGFEGLGPCTDILPLDEKVIK